MKITKNFLMVSNYNADISWILDYTDNYIIYDRSDTDEWTKPFDQSKVRRVKNIGWDIYDKLTYIIDNYENLPNSMIMTKGNIFKYITKPEFDIICNNTYFTPIFTKHHKTYMPDFFYGKDGMYNEINNSWYLNALPTKYFSNYNQFIKPFGLEVPKYLKFAPGSNYIVTKENIQKHSKSFYEQLRRCIDYSALPGEAQIIERFLYILWTTDKKFRPEMIKLVPRNIFYRIYKKILSFFLYKILKNMKTHVNKIKNIKEFPLLESDALQEMCNYSFGDHSGVLGHVPRAYMKKANINNKEFIKIAKRYEKRIMTLFIDNIRLYKRPLEYSDWLHRKPISYTDKKWLNTIKDEDLLDLCSKFPNNKFIIFTALEDTPLDKYIEGKIPENVISINAANAVYFGGKIKPYPHGLERKMYLFYNHHKILRRFLNKKEIIPKKLLFVSHREDTGNRIGIKNIFENKEWATVPKRLKYKLYLEAIKNHKFVLCPSGNGIESARNWETLYMKRVPVFKDHPYLREMFKNFPVLFVNDFNEITKELLLENENLYQKVLNINMDKLNLKKIFKERIKTI